MLSVLPFHTVRAPRSIGLSVLLFLTVRAPRSCSPYRKQPLFYPLLHLTLTLTGGTNRWPGMDSLIFFLSVSFMPFVLLLPCSPFLCSFSSPGMNPLSVLHDRALCPCFYYFMLWKQNHYRIIISPNHYFTQSLFSHYTHTHTYTDPYVLLIFCFWSIVCTSVLRHRRRTVGK